MRFLVCFLFFLALGCETGNLKVIADLPSSLDEVSGIQLVPFSEHIWMLNDGGNSPKLYSVTPKGKIKTELKIKAKNNDWEDLTSDNEGNIYIGDFGNNLNKRKNLAILKVSKDSLNKKGKIEIERINFSFPDQTKFPPKKKHMRFDCEAFFYLNDYFYVFTKSRKKQSFGLTYHYKIPAKRGNHVAEFIASFKTCDELPCWITSADISSDGKKVALLTLDAVWVFKDFEEDNFFSGNHVKNQFEFESQKESVSFYDESTLLIADEKAHGKGGKLYLFKLD